MPALIDKNEYSQLLAEFQPKAIESKEEYDRVRHKISLLMKEKFRTPEQTALLKLLAALVKDFDNKNFSMEPASPLEVLLHLMEENEVKQADLVGKVGSSGVVSEIINGKRGISKAQAKALGKIFHVSPSVFI